MAKIREKGFTAGMSDEEVDKEIQALAARYGIKIKRNGGATATIGTTQVPDAAPKESGSETPKAAVHKTKTTAKPASTKSLRKKPPQTKTVPIKKTERKETPKVEETKSTTAPKKQGVLGIPNYLSLDSEGRRKALRESAESQRKLRGEACAERTLKIVKPEASSQMAAYDWQKKRKKKQEEKQ